ncbi:MAG: type II CAAX endopeptidase family protein [Bacillota bacterium]|nr:type II CAAX endopeptidase family protein [Bacillota bacterium]
MSTNLKIGSGFRVQDYPYPQFQNNYGYINQFPNYPTIDYEKTVKRIKAKSDFNTVGIAVITYFLCFLIITLVILISIFGLNGLSNLDIPSSFESLIDGTVSLLSLFVSTIIICAIKKIHPREFISFRRDKSVNIASVIFIGISICMLANLATSLLASNLNMFGLNYTIPDTTQFNSPFDIVTAIFSVCVVPAFVEEFAFRGFILHSLRKHGDSFAIFASALLFGLLHGNFTQAPFAFIVGLVLGYVVVKTNSLLPAMLIHFFNNFYSVVMDFISNLNFITSEVFSIISDATLIAIIIIGIVLFAKIAKKQKSFFKLQKQDLIFNFKQNTKMFFSSAGVIVAIIFTLSEAVYSMITVMLSSR